MLLFYSSFTDFFVVSEYSHVNGRHSINSVAEQWGVGSLMCITIRVLAVRVRAGRSKQWRVDSKRTEQVPRKVHPASIGGSNPCQLFSLDVWRSAIDHWSIVCNARAEVSD